MIVASVQIVVGELLVALALLASGGVERAAENGAQASLTPNGRLLVYIQNDPKGVADVLVLDRRSGRRERVSVGSRGQRGKGASIEPSISDDGRFVAFCSYAPNFSPDDQPRPGGRVLNPHFYRDVYVRDRRRRTTTRISVARTSGPPSSWSCHPSISGNGRFVAFISDAKNLVRGDRDEHANVFLHDRTIRRTIRLPGAELDAAGARPVFSRDGRWLAYSTIPGGLMMRDGRTGRSTRIGPGGGPSISADGRYVAYTHGAPMHAFVHDRATGRTTDLGEADTVRLAANGRVAATHWSDRVFVRNLVTGRTARVDDPRIYGLHWTTDFLGGISGNGQVVPFVSSTYDGVPAGQRRQALFLRIGW
jgi:Tol biopolymer transport system component